MEDKPKPQSVALAACAVLALLGPGVGAGQSSAKTEFEVASVRPSGGGRERPDVQSGKLRLGARTYGDRAEYIYMSLRQLLADAYQVQSFQVDGPEWLQTERFDIIAKMPPGTRKDDTHGMLQALLAARFKLAVHRESRDEDVMGLVTDKSGPKLVESPEGSAAAGASPDQPPGPAASKKGSGPSASVMMGTVAVRVSIDQGRSLAHWEASGMGMSDLTHLLMRIGVGNGRPVVDLTGLKGKYDVALDIPLALFGGLTSDTEDRPADSRRPADAASDPAGGSVMQSLRRLGLDLKKTKAPVQRLVVDQMERTPTEN